MTADDVVGGRWNHNLRYHRWVLDAVPARCTRALDVGCGEGILTRQLRLRVPEVTGIDLDEPSLERARTHSADVGYVHGDFLTHDFEPASFDLVASVATLHHVDAEGALHRMRALLRPGGVLAVVGLARPGSPADLALLTAGRAASLVARARRGYWEHSAPLVWPPPESYRSMRRIASTTLPGAQLRRRLYLRYSLLWRKPA